MSQLPIHRVLEKKKADRQPPISPSSAFPQLLRTVSGLTVLSGAVALWLSCQTSLSPQQNKLFEACYTTSQMGVLTILGLLGGSKVASSFQTRDDE